VRAVLYEGYALYPYRPSALKNRRRFAFGAIYPRAWAERTGDPCFLRAEVVATSVTAIYVRFLRLERGGGAHEVLIDVTEAKTYFERDGIALEITTAWNAGRFSIEILNVTRIETTDHETVMDFVPSSTHVVLHGELFSAIDPPPHLIDSNAACRSSGLYPILVGPRTMLASPIILPDYPEIAPESPGDFFDGTEMDEMLTLRVLTMTEAEKREVTDPKVAAMIARTEELGVAATARLHGVVRNWLREGTRVVVRPGKNADSFDLLLAGKRATVAKVERDLEGRVYCAVTIDDDPGADLGATGMPGHRFFFRPDELEVVS
jgi:hypothetical protein